MELELALPLFIIRLNYSKRRYVFRVLKLSLNYSIRVEFKSTIRSISKKTKLDFNSNTSSLDFNS